jgi:phage terminase small subunit
MPKPFNAKHQLFIAHYIATGHGTNSAIAAGYSEKTARSQASTLLTNPNIVDAIAKGIKEQSKQIKIDADYVKNQAVILHRRATLEDPVVDSNGKVVDGQVYDPTTAHKALKMIGEHKDVKAFDNSIRFGGDPDNPIVVEHLSGVDRAARIADIFKKAMVAHEKEKKK